MRFLALTSHPQPASMELTRNIILSSVGTSRSAPNDRQLLLEKGW